MITHEFRDPPIEDDDSAMAWRGCDAQQAEALRSAGFEVRRVHRIDFSGNVAWTRLELPDEKRTA